MVSHAGTVHFGAQKNPTRTPTQPLKAPHCPCIPPAFGTQFGPRKAEHSALVYTFKGFKTQHYANKFALCELFRRLKNVQLCMYDRILLSG